MATIGNIVIGIKVSTGALGKGLKSAAGMISSFGASINAINPAILSFVGNVGGKAVSALTSLVTEGFDRIDETNDLAQRLGTSTEALSALQYAAAQSGASAEGLAASLQKMNVNLASGGADASLKKLGLSAKELEALAPDQAFLKISEAFQTVDSPAQQAALAMDIFGKSGLEVLNVLNAGPEELGRLTAEADKLGISFKSVDANKVANAKDSMDKLKAAVGGLGNVLAVNVAPFVTSLIEQFLEWAQTGINVSGTVGTALEYVAKGVGIVADVVHTLKLGFLLLQSGVTKVIAFILDAVGQLAKGLQYVINLIPGMKADFADFATAAAEDLHKLAGEQFDNFNEEFLKDPPSENINKWFQNIKNASNATTEDLNKGKRAVDQLDESFLKVAESVKKLEDNLKEQIDTFGMSAEAADIFKLKQAGASEETLANAKALAGQLDQLKKNKELEDDLANRAKTVFEATRTPLEKYNAELKDLNELLAAGKIDQETFARAKAAADKELEPKDKPAEQKNLFAGALELGSQQAREIVLKQKFGAEGNDPIKRVEKVNKDQLAQLQQAVGFLGQIAKQKIEELVF